MAPINHRDSLHAPTPNLPIELIAEILCRLPVKFLMQLTCVCKSWKTLISNDPNFAKKHLSTFHPHPYHLLLSFGNPLSPSFLLRSYSLRSIFKCSTSTTTSSQLNYPFNIRNRFHAMVGSCHGMLCFAINHNRALLWNPTIRKFKKLPPLKSQRRMGSYTTYGFGYDHFSDTYKVVAVCSYSCVGGGGGILADKTEVNVHTLGTNSWRRIQEFPSGVPNDSSGKFVSGTLNWLAYDPNAWRSRLIVSLDLGKETYQEVLQPDYGVAVVSLTLRVFRECLCIFAHINTFASDVWLMNDYGNKESWTKLFRVPFMGHPNLFPDGLALCISEDEEVLLKFRRGLLIYDSRNGTYKNPEIQDTNGWVVPEVYVESLVSPCF